MEKFANEGGMITEQVWDVDDLPDGGMKRGHPTGAAMPLCWSHAEYVTLVRSRHDGVCFDRVEPAFQRYVAKPVPSRHEIWSLRHPLRRVPKGKVVRLILPAESVVAWSTDGWSTTTTCAANKIGELNVWYTDLPTETLPGGSVVEFRLSGNEGRNWRVSID
jgi:glucoamylase